MGDPHYFIFTFIYIYSVRRDEPALVSYVIAQAHHQRCLNARHLSESSPFGLRFYIVGSS